MVIQHAYPTKPNIPLVKAAAVGALGGLLFGFDTAVIAGTTRSLAMVYNLTPSTLGLTVSIALWGTVVGSMTAGVIGQRIGGRETLKVLALLYIVSGLGCAVAWNWTVLVLSRFLGGLAIGGSSVLGPVYIAEVSPPDWRGRLVGLFQINIVIGILLAYLSNYSIVLINLGSTEWRWQLGIATIPAAFFFALLFGIPHSPRWLVMRGRINEAREVLRIMGSQNGEAEVSDILDSVNLERTATKQTLFSRKYRFPIFLAISMGMFNQLAGVNAILYYLNDIFAAAGFSRVSGNLQAVAVGAMNLFATLLAMTVIDRLGRKTLLLIGSVGLVGCLSGIAEIFFSHQHREYLLWLLVGYIGFFAFSQGAVIWVYIGEVFPNSVRSKGQSLGSSSHWIMNAVVSGLFPVFAKASGAYPFVFFAAMMGLQFVVVLLFFPETKGISLEEIEHHLEMV